MKKIFSPYKADCNQYSSVIKLPADIAAELFTDKEMADGQARFDIKTFGPWHIPQSAYGIVIEAINDGNSTHPTGYIIYGKRTMTNWTQMGYEAEGTVSIANVKRSCFTSSHLFEINGKLLSSSVLYLHTNRK